MAEKGAKPVRPARVLYVENGIGYGGAVVCLRHLVRNLDRSRFEPIVVTGKSGVPYQGIAREATWLPLRDRLLDTLRWQRRIERSRFARSFPILAALLRKAVGRLDDVVNFLPLLARLVLTIARTRPALVHANNDPMCNRAALIAACLVRVPVISHVRGNAGEPTRTQRWLFSLPVQFIAVSRWISDGLLNYGVPREKRTCVYDGIELGSLDPHADGAAFRSRWGLAHDEFVVGLVGLLIPWKGQRLFLEAGHHLLDRIPNLRLVIAGGTPEMWTSYEHELRAEAARPGLAGRVLFTGHIDDMAQAYNGLDAVVSASTAPEPLGTMVIEALALGRPLIAPAHGGAAEMIEHEHTGLLFAPGDPRALAAAIHRLHADRTLGEALGRAARERALRTFSVRQHVQQVQAVYERLLGASGEHMAAKLADRGGPTGA